MRCSLALIAGALMLSASALTSYAEEEGGSNVMFIFDSSGSMKKQIASGESRSDAAKRAMVAALSGMPPEAKLGLLMYGHRRAKDCTDIEMVAPFGATDSNGIAQTILDSQPKGETPIAAALESAASSFASLPGQSNSVVLVTDGIEECGGDPCAAARAIREAGIGLKVHVVGFTLSDEQRQTVQCVADETRGKYFDAQDADGLSGALAEVQKAVAEVPAEPVRERVFFDEFDGADLAEHWSVINPNPDGYVVEKGALLMVNSALGSFDKADSANIIQLQRDLPAEDWDIHVTFTGEFKSGQDRFSVGLRTDDKNFLSADLTTKAHYLGSYMWLSLVKNTDGTATRVDTIISHDPGITLGEEQLVAYTNKLAASSMKLTISKRGRAYSTAFTVQGDGKQIVHRTESLTSLRSPGKLAVGVGKWAEANGEIMINIESIEIETVKAAP